MSRCGAIILAAGGSSRLGEAKQLVNCGGESLLARTVRIALMSRADPVVVVLGAEFEACVANLGQSPVLIVRNRDWQEGIASSLRAGIAALDDTVDGAVILLCDQPLISVSLIDDLITCAQPIAVSAYRDTLGPPAYFSHRFFNELLRLRGDVGAKKVINAHLDEVAVISFPEGAFDIDTPNDREQMITSGVQLEREMIEL